MKRILALGLTALVLPALAARLTITSYGIPHSYPLKPSDELSFDANGLYATVTSVDTVSKQTSHKAYFLGYSNKVTFSTAGGALSKLWINTADSGVVPFDMAKVDSISFNPTADTVDSDGDGLTDFQELMVYHTSPKDKDSDGDGLTDYVEAINLNRNLYSPLVANLPGLTTQLAGAPRLYYKTSKNGSVTSELTQGTSENWGTEEGSSKSIAQTNSASIAAGVTFKSEFEVTGGTAGASLRQLFSLEARLDVTSGYEVSNAWSYDRRASYNQALELQRTQSTSAGWDSSGANLKVPVMVTNSGSIGFTLSNVNFTIYGTSFINGYPVDEAICTVAGKGGEILPQATAGPEVLECNDLTMAEAAKFGRYDLLRVGVASKAINYTLEGNAITLAGAVTAVNGRTARISVDFGDALKSQESPLVRQVAMMTKWLPETQDYAPVFLGEALTQMGLTYGFDSTGFAAVNGLARNPTNCWWTGIARNKAGGRRSDTLEANFGAMGGPDSVRLFAGDEVLLVYSGDDDHDGVLNAVEKLAGTFDKLSADYDSDGIPDSLEVYGWKKMRGPDTAKYFTNPKKVDSDGDGISDFLDPDPMVQMISAHANLLKLRLQDQNGNVYDSLGFSRGDTASQVAVKLNRLGAAIRFQIVLDSQASSASAIVKKEGGAIAKLSFTRDPLDASGIVMQSEVTSGNPLFAIGNDTIVITVKALDGLRARTWTLTGTSTPIVASSLLGRITRDLLRPTKSIHPTLNLTQQYAVDPRVTGMLLYRRESGTVAARPQLLKNNQLPGNLVGLTLVANLGVSDKSSDVTLGDSVGTKSGASYEYLAIPYANSSDNQFVFPDSSLLGYVKAEKPLMRIVFQAEWVNWRCIDEADGTGEAEIAIGMRVQKNRPGEAYTTIIQHAQQWDGIIDGTLVELGNWPQEWWGRANQWTSQEEEAVSAQAFTKEIDCDWDTDHPKCMDIFNVYPEDDHQFKGPVFEFNVGKLITATAFANMGISGYGVDDKNSTTLTLQPNGFPTAAHPNVLSYVTPVPGHQADATLTIHYNLNWWFEEP